MGFYSYSCSGWSSLSPHMDNLEDHFRVLAAEFLHRDGC